MRNREMMFTFASELASLLGLLVVLAATLGPLLFLFYVVGGPQFLIDLSK